MSRQPVTCAVASCNERVRPGQLMCRAHWFELPKALRDDVWRTWRRVQRWSGSPLDSRRAEIAAYRVAVTAAREWFSAQQTLFQATELVALRTADGRALTFKGHAL